MPSLHGMRALPKDLEKLRSAKYWPAAFERQASHSISPRGSKHSGCECPSRSRITFSDGSSSPGSGRVADSRLLPTVSPDSCHPAVAVPILPQRRIIPQTESMDGGRAYRPFVVGDWVLESLHSSRIPLMGQQQSGRCAAGDPESVRIACIEATPSPRLAPRPRSTICPPDRTAPRGYPPRGSRR
jgi:hypothetical protein